MRLIDLKDLTLEQLKAFVQPGGDLTPEEKAEVSRLFMEQLSDADLQSVNWDDATPFEDFLNELKEEQRQWDEQKR